MSLNEMFELIVMKVGSFLAIELTACEGECASSKDASAENTHCQ